MTRDDAIVHWRRGAIDALEAAALLHAGGKYALTLFHCHLAVEKALKALFIAQRDSSPPATHDLLDLAEELDGELTDDERVLLDTLSDFAVLARYGDGVWEEVQATETTSAMWLKQATRFLSHLQL